ncbi:MAG TPA: methionyl-tRNA formyltransferase [Chthoniobacterales bacterium]|nr:methionyl-tRNA formyltransferase [Chthoniobacterales bacterium]
MQIVFIGTGEIGVPTLRALRHTPRHQLIGVVTQPDKPVGRDQHFQASPIKAELARSSVPVFQPARIRNDDAVAQIRWLKPDVVVVMAYGQILPKSVLEIPRIACLNLHASLLPLHRGAAPIQAAIVAGDTGTGITVIYMDEGLDTGDIFLQAKLAISPTETGGSLHERLAQLAPDALLAALEQLANHDAPRAPQDSSRATYAPKLTREHGKIDWSEPAEMIERKIRAFDPWPGTFTLLVDAAGKPRHLKIFRAAVVPQGGSEPGSITTPNDAEILVATSRDALRLDEVQLEGKRRMSAAEFLRGFSSPRLHF